MTQPSSLLLALWLSAAAVQAQEGALEAPPPPPEGAKVEPRAGDSEPKPETVAAPASKERPWSLDLTVHDVGLGLGGSRHIDGLRLNLRDTAPFTARGVNLTLWTPAAEARGSEVDGLALGLPLTGADTLRGLGLGVGVAAGRKLEGVALGALGAGSGGSVRGLVAGGLGAGAGRDLDGLGLAGLGVGAGGRCRGVVLAGLGAGCGEGLTGLAAGGLGAGAGGRVRGLLLGGLGAGAGGDLDGLVLAGLGAGAGGDVRGIALAGLGVGAGGDLTGFAAALAGVGAGGKLRGFSVAGLGVGSGHSIDGIAVAGLGVGAPRIRGVAAALGVGAKDVTGLVIAPAWFRLEKGGQVRGVSVSAFNQVRGAQYGLAVGLLNVADELHGVQLGLVNWAGNNPAGLRLLPVVNAHFD